MESQNRPQLSDILQGLQLLTRLPLPAGTQPIRPAAAWAWPLAGAVVTGFSLCAAGLALPAGPGIAAGVALCAQAMLTGAMHEDGLADSADGLWGGWDRGRRLDIMKDSHIGTYGVLALLLSCLIRWVALTALIAAGQWFALIAVGAASRASIAVAMALLPNARGSGLSQSVGHPPFWSAALAVMIGVLALLVSTGWAGLAAILAIVLASAIVAGLARAKIGGQTGDILGAIQQVSEAVALSVLTALAV
ncbi:MAG: adenosylcobinamide-GDP ribazoletransferase [Pseudorhodobacter sp.]